jgi:Undecaprenyl-phosphate glucose phosphotransferase
MLSKPASLITASGEAGLLLRLRDDGRNLRTSFITPRVLGGLVRIADFVLALATGFLVASLYVQEQGAAWRADYVLVTTVTGLAVVAALEAFGRYTPGAFSNIAAGLPRLFAGWAMAFGLLETGLFFYKHGAEISRGWVGLWFVVGFVVLAVERLLLAYQVRRWAEDGRMNRRAVIYGAGPVTVDMIRHFEADPGIDVRIAGIFDDRSMPRATGSLNGYPVLGGLTDLIQFCRKTRVDLVIVSLPIAGESRLAEVVRQLAVLPADVKLPARASAIRFSPRTYSHIGTVAMIDLFDQPLAGWGTFLKWLFDKVVAALAILALAPVMAVIAAFVKMETPGPVVFRQKRYGFNNELIEVWKFRSMHDSTADVNAAKLVTKNDPRVTRVGHFIRKSSLDELPQLFNVLRGDLSLVGPRPHALEAKAAERHYDDVVDGYFARHKVKPGITGWAQINGWRGETDTPEKIEKRVEHDLYYIENWSLLFDVYILLRTPAALLKAERTQCRTLTPTRMSSAS